MSKKEENNNALLPESKTRSNNASTSNPMATRNTRNSNSKIFEKIINIYVQRHAVSCANTIEKVFGKGQNEKSEHAANSGISYVGVQQCLQVSDYFSKNPINNTKVTGPDGIERKPLLIFCCSELIRTHQTLFLSWIRYLKEYQGEEKNGKIIVIPWLNEVSALKVSVPKVGSKIFNKDNYPESFDKTIKNWEKFIKNLKTNDKNIKNDTCNSECDLGDLKDWENWENLFYLSSVIYKKNVQNRFRNNAKIIQIRRTGILQKMGDLDQFIQLFGKILDTYISEQNINMSNYDGIELVIVAHHNSAEKFMEFILPSTHDIFKKQQLVNCEVVKLPGKCLSNFVNKAPSDSFQMERIFPMAFNTELSISINGKMVYPMFILYISELDLFLSVNNIVKTCLKVDGMNECVKIMGPLQIFLGISILDYRIQLGKIKDYIKIIIENYKRKEGSTFYDYDEMTKKVEQKMRDLNIYMTRRQRIGKNINPTELQKSSIKNYVENQMNSQLQPAQFNAQKEMQNFIERKKKLEKPFDDTLNKYLFDMCELNDETIKLITTPKKKFKNKFKNLFKKKEN